MASPESYLNHLADCLVAALGTMAVDDQDWWYSEFRASLADMDIDQVNVHGLDRRDAVRALLSDANPSALQWAGWCIAHGLAQPANPDDPDSVIGRLRWPNGSPGSNRRVWD